MIRRMFKSKIHRATITHADLDYEGSVTIDADLLDLADILPYEAVDVWNVTRGSRLTTYALSGPRGSGVLAFEVEALLDLLFDLKEDPGERRNLAL